ncbi:MAG: isoprenylcysteine carboxylmethyltransferase family protein [Symploca sp. SIO3E6]|nr:isoprenylcysteine carboxylmethyltransferase family protein [Caldora sp. SIO3E6]
MERPFVVIYLVGVCIAGLIRVIQSRKYQRSEKPQVSVLELWLMLLWLIASQILPMVYGFRAIVSFANYPLPHFLSILGIGVLVLSLWLLRQSHVDLGQNWSPIAEIQADQVLVTQGVYRYVRHPMYSAHLLWGLAQGLLIANWLVGWSGLIAFALVYWVRVPPEEAMMQERFGQDYLEYKQDVGAVLPFVG